MRKFALSGLLVASAFVATTLSGAEVTPQAKSGGTARIVGDAVVIGDSRLGVINKVDLSFARNGQLKWLSVTEVEKGPDGVYRWADEAKRNDPVPANRDVLPVQIEVMPGQTDPPNRKMFTEKNGMSERRYYERYYLQMIEGDPVEFNQKIGQLDDRLTRAEFYSKEAKLEASRADVVAAEKTRDESKIRMDGAPRLVNVGAMSKEDGRAAEVTYERYKSEYVSKVKMVDVAREELNQARTMLELHELRSPIRGRIKAIYKNPGEALREQEPVVQIYNLEKLRVEGLVDAQHRDRIKPGMKAILESPRRFTPRTLKGHLQEVTCIAVSNAKDRPLIVSGSEDGTLRIWDVNAATPEVQVYTHPQGKAFRAVACSPAGARGNYCLAGSADGIVWLFDLDKRTAEPVWKKEGHGKAVTMVAFSPDGTRCITAGEDRPHGSICLWDAASGETKSVLPSVHVGAITAVHFTAGNHVVSAARDNTVRYWTPGTDGKYQAALTVPKRSGDVPNLGVSPDGKLVLFDQGKELRLLTLPEGKYAGSLANATGTSPFTTMALFSPDGKLVLTAGAGEGRMQLWRVPAGGRRGQEVVQMIAADRSQPTCGAFAPGGQFIATGSKDRLIHVWGMPTKEEVDEQIVAEVMHVEAAIESGGRQVRIRADVPNPNNRLLLNDTVTMVIYPQ